MIEIKFGLMLKPDAISEISLFSVGQFQDCLISLNSILAHTNLDINSFFLPQSKYSHEGAIRQITERALSERSFALPIIGQELISKTILKELDEINKSKRHYSLLDIIEYLIYYFNLKIYNISEFGFDEEDCRRIYKEVLDRDFELFQSIRQYLVNKVCRIYFLNGDQSLTAIEYIKTYVRYFFKYNSGEKHRLENYLHSLDENETNYFFKKLVSN